MLKDFFDKLLTLPDRYEHFLLIVAVIIAAFVLSKVLRIVLDRFFEKSSALIRVEATKYRFLKNAVTFIIFIAASLTVIYLIPAFKHLALSLFAGAGIFAAFLGFASQQAFSNIVSGIFIVIFKPFRVGDFIKIGTDVLGQVEDITLRHTVINGLENRRIIIPNSSISTDTIVNSSITDDKICRFVEMDISYDSDVDKAMKIMEEEALAHPSCLDNRSEEDLKKGVPQVIIRLTQFMDSAVRLRAYVWAKDTPTAFVMHCDLNYSIKKRFDAEGIEIPFPHRTLVFKNGQQELPKPEKN